MILPPSVVVVLNHASVEKVFGPSTGAPAETSPSVVPLRAEAVTPVVPSTAPGVVLLTPLPYSGADPPAQSIPLNIAEGNGKRSTKDRARYVDFARGSALECSAIQDVLVVSGSMEQSDSVALKTKLKRIVAMLTRLAFRADSVSESPATYRIDYEHEHEHDYEHRFAEHERW